MIDNGRDTAYNKFFEAIQDAEIYFSMRNIDTGIMKVSKAKAYLKRLNDGGCDEKYAVCYQWKKHDTNEFGTFEGQFEFVFNGNITCNEYSFPQGNLIAPIEERLLITIK